MSGKLAAYEGSGCSEFIVCFTSFCIVLAMDDAQYLPILQAAEQAWGENWHQNLDYTWVYQQLGMDRGRRINATARRLHDRLWSDLNAKFPAPAEEEPPAGKKRKKGQQGEKTEVKVHEKFAAVPAHRHLGGRYGLASAVQDKSMLEPGVAIVNAGIWGMLEEDVAPYVAAAGAGPNALMAASGGQERKHIALYVGSLRPGEAAGGLSASC